MVNFGLLAAEIGPVVWGVRSFVLLGQEPSLFWTPARRPSAGPVRLPMESGGELVGVCSVCATCRTDGIIRHE